MGAPNVILGTKWLRFEQRKMRECGGKSAGKMEAMLRLTHPVGSRRRQGRHVDRRCIRHGTTNVSTMCEDSTGSRMHTDTNGAQTEGRAFPYHDIHVQPVCACLHHAGSLLADLGEIALRWRNTRTSEMQVLMMNDMTKNGARCFPPAYREHRGGHDGLQSRSLRHCDAAWSESTAKTV